MFRIRLHACVYMYKTHMQHVSVYAYRCIFVNMYAYIYIYVYVYVHMCVDMGIDIDTVQLRMHAGLHVYVFVVDLCTCKQMRLHESVCTLTLTYICPEAGFLNHYTSSLHWALTRPGPREGH